MSPATGNTVWGPVNSSSSLASGPAVGGSSGAPLVYYGLNSPHATASIFSLSANSGGAVASCDATASVFGSCPGTGFVRDLQVLSIASDGSAAVVEDDEHSGFTAAGADCGNEGYAGTHLSSSCSGWFSTVVATTGTSVGGNSMSGAAIGRSGQAFIADRGVPREIPVGGGSFTAGAANDCIGKVIVTDNGGSDAPVCEGQRTTYSGGAFSFNWSATFTGALENAGFLVVSSGGAAQPLGLSSGGSSGAALASRVALAVDASTPPVVYLASGATLSTQRFSGGAFGAAAWGMPALPGASISDVVMDRNGILYVASNGQVSAIVTDSPGLGTAGNGWAIRGRDACRSYNLEYSCPY